MTFARPVPDPPAPPAEPVHTSVDVAGVTVELVIDDAPLPMTLPGDGRWTFGPAGEVVVSSDGRQAWFLRRDEDEDERALRHARVTSALPAGLRLLPILDFEERGCMSWPGWGLLDASAGLVRVPNFEPVPTEAVGADRGADETVLLRWVRRSPRSGRERILVGPRRLVEAAPSGRAPGGWMLERSVALISGPTHGLRRPSYAAPGLSFAMLREGSIDRYAAARYWMEIDGRRIHVFDAESELPEGGIGGTWRSGNRALVWLWQPFDSGIVYALVDLDTGRRLGAPVAANVEPDWELCSAAALHDHRLLAVLHGDQVDLVMPDPDFELGPDRAIRWEAPGDGFGRLVVAKLPTVEYATSLPPVLHEVACGAARCLVQAPGEVTAGGLDEEPL